MMPLYVELNTTAVLGPGEIACKTDAKRVLILKVEHHASASTLKDCNTEASDNHNVQACDGPESSNYALT
jgi:hypothetical protein